MNTRTSNNIFNASNSNIIWETSDIERGIGLILFEREGWFQLHIWNEDEDYNNSALIMDLGSDDLAKLYDVLSPFVGGGGGGGGGGGDVDRDNDMKKDEEEQERE